MRTSDAYYERDQRGPRLVGGLCYGALMILETHI